MNSCLFVFVVKVPKAKDEVVEREFNRLLEACSYVAQTLDEDINGKKQPYSLGDTLELLIRAQEKAVREKYLQHLRDISKMKDSLKTILIKV
jgi:lysine-specific histone demethylase 1